MLTVLQFKQGIYIILQVYASYQEWFPNHGITFKDTYNSKPVHISVPHNLGICAILRSHCAFSESRNCVPILGLCTRFVQSQDSAAPGHNLKIVQHQCVILRSCNFLLHEKLNPGHHSSFHHYKVSNVHKELLQLRHHHQHWACTQASCARDFWEVCQLRETSFSIDLGRGAERCQTCGALHSRLQQLGKLSTQSSISQLQSRDCTKFYITWNIHICLNAKVSILA